MRTAALVQIALATALLCPVAEFHPWYGSAAAMLLPRLHKQVTPSDDRRP